MEVVDVNSNVVFFPCRHPFVHVLLLLPFSCENPGLNSHSRLRIFSFWISVSIAPSLCSSYGPLPWGPRPCVLHALTQHHPNSLCIQSVLPPASSPPALISCMLLPYMGTALTFPRLLIRPQVSYFYFCPFLQPVIPSFYPHNGASLPSCSC